MFEKIFSHHAHLSEKDMISLVLHKLDEMDARNTLEFHLLNQKIDKIMSTQDQINADVAALQAVFTKIGADVAAINSGIAALQAQVGSGTPVDLTQLDALAAQGASVQTAADAAAASLAPAPVATT